MEDNKTHKVYIATVSFTVHEGTPMRIVARDEAHARELIPQMLPKHLEDLKILDIVSEDAIQRPNPDAPTPEVEDDEPKQVH